MIDHVLQEILRRRPGTLWTRIAWAAFLVLFPVAYAIGAFIERKEVQANAPRTHVDRGAAIATARQFLTDQGLDVAAWNSYVSLDAQQALLTYYQHQAKAAAAKAEAFAPAIRVRVLLTSPTNDSAEVDLGRDGRVNDYDFTHVKEPAGKTVDEHAAAAIASATAATIPHVMEFTTLGKPEVETLERTTGAPCRKSTWHTTSRQLTGLNLDIDSSVCGTRPASRHVHATIDAAYAKKFSTGTPLAIKALVGLYGLYVTVVIIYSLYRYARRALDGEISHGRTLLLAALITISLLLGLGTAVDEYVFGVYSGNHSVLWVPLLVVGVTYAMGGLLFATAYEAGEGDVREVAPGKMTSLDAFLRGRIFSRNVARSVLFGTAMAGWLLLFECLVIGVPAVSAATTEALKIPFFRFPLLAIFTSQAVIVTLIPATALLLPVAFVHRNVSRRHLRNALLVLFAILGCLLQATRHSSALGALASVSVVAGCLLGAFVGLDFLAAVVSLLAFQVARALAGMTALAPRWELVGIVVAVITAVFLGIEVWAALHGREYHDIEVRPLYASNIAERQQLQAEVAAAREAQLRLLPKTMPDVAGLSIAAACIPARVVGGDFYDFFRLGDHRLGIFIAEGGNRGIASALNIALAKGFLMHTVRRGLAPHDIVMRLELALGTLICGVGASTYVAYAVVDTAAGRLWYARTGEYPKVLVSSRPVMERKIELPGSDKVVYEGGSDLRGGDTVLLVTDGIASKVRINGARAADQVLEALGRKRRSQELEDDLTAVVVRVERVGSAIGVVA